MAMVVSFCVFLLLGLSGTGRAEEDFRILLACDSGIGSDVLIAELIETVFEVFAEQNPELSPSYQTVWLNQSNFIILALHNSILEGNWTAVLDLTSDCFLADAPELSTPIYIALAFCGPDIPSISPPPLKLLQAAVDVLRSQMISLSHLAIILDEKHEVIEDGTAAVLNGSALTMIPLYNGSLIDLVLRRLVKESTHLATIVIGTSEQTKYVLQTACGLNSLLASVNWVVIATDWMELDCPPCELDSIIYLSHPGINSSLYQRLPLNVRSKISKEETFKLWDSLQAVLHIWNSTYSTSDSGDDQENKTVTKKIDTASGSMDVDDGIMNHRVELDIYEVGCQGNKTNTSIVGRWSDGSVNWYTNSRMVDAKAYRLRVTTFHEPPFVFKERLENGSIAYSGYAIDVLDEIMAKLHKEYDIYEASDKTYGVLLPNGKWNGLVGELVDGTADIAIGPISVTAERESAVDFTTPYYDFAGIQIVMKKIANEPNMFAFSDVFAKDVWLCWAAVLCTTAILIFVFERFSPFSTRNASSSPPAGTVYDFKESWWFVITSFTMSGSESTPKPMSTRMLVAGFWFFCSIMMSTYTANLAAHLTLSRLNVPVESLDDLAAQSEIKYSALEGSTVQTYFHRMAEIEKNFYTLWKDMSYGDIKSSSLQGNNYAVWDYPLGDKYQNIWKHMELNGFLNSSQQGMAKVLMEDFAFFHDSPMIKYELSKRCDLEVIGGQFSTKPYAFALRENSALTKEMSNTILELQQERKLDDLKEQWWSTGGKTCENKDENDGLTFETVAGIFIVMAAGTVLSVVVLVVELTCYRIYRKRKKETVEDMKDQNSSIGTLEKSGGSDSTLSSRL